MNKFLWISRTVVVIAGIGFLNVSFTSKNIETPNYKVIKTFDEVELRLYPKMAVAKTNLAEKSFDNQGINGFRTIVDYIFDGNEYGRQRFHTLCDAKIV
jgi:hypothetical protein